MSFPKEKREHIKRYILEKISARSPDVVKQTVQTFDISPNTVYRYIRELETTDIIKKDSSGYYLTTETKYYKLQRSNNELVNEDLIYHKYIRHWMEDSADNVRRIWEYSFTEMMNNAIDHSNAETVDIIIKKSYLNTVIFIKDNGIGIFRKIKEFYHYAQLDDAVKELFKGKLTTDSDNHSGEGIFFTSRALDNFAAVSDGKIFTHSKYKETMRNLADIEGLRQYKDSSGTIIYMELSNFSNKILKEVFDMFSDEDHGFTKTHIPIKNFYETYPVSRSQAKRLCHRLDKVQEIELDFAGVSEIGQGFAHELFVVFQRKNQTVKITPVNTSKEIEKMIKHVKNTTL